MSILKRVAIYILGFFLVFSVFLGCSSAPSRPSDIFTDRDMALKQLNLATYTANRGRFQDALLILEEARRLAVSADDPALRIKTSLSRGNFLFSLGRQTHAFFQWEIAAREAEASGEAVLAALARIYTIRARLIMLESNESLPGVSSTVEELRAAIDKEMTAVRSDNIATAAAYITLGLAEKQSGRWAEAESAMRRALDIHERNRFLEDAAYDWFLIASIRSVAGNYDGALDALRTAIAFDRRTENGYGLASSWQAIADVNLKAGRPNESRAALRRAAEIYRAIGLMETASELESRL